MAKDLKDCLRKMARYPSKEKTEIETEKPKEKIEKQGIDETALPKELVKDLESAFNIAPDSSEQPAAEPTAPEEKIPETKNEEATPAIEHNFYPSREQTPPKPSEEKKNESA